MDNGIKACIVTEGNLKAVKDLDDHNMWYLYVKETNGFWDNVQWMNVDSIQRFFNEKLPRYEEINPNKKFREII
jgi:hypothetical protein